ncbi:MAG: SBBP repeat-containing protein, partial [Bryobacterales bacterium]|nr:SBBP repeat-containing protein [Bryobacterales bacterium]
MKSFASFRRNLARKPSAALGFLLLLTSVSLSAARLTESYGKLPLRFEPNRGQADSRVRFLSRGPGYTMRLLDSGAEIALGAGGKRALVRMRLEGSVPPAEATLLEPLPGVSNYFAGGDPSQWRTGIPGYARVSYTGVYPGVDLICYGNQQQLEYDFRIAPHADARRIRLAYDGVDSLRIDPSGDLLLETPAGILRQHKPAVYQEIDGRKVERTAGYRLEAGRKVTFALGPYDRSRPLIIDPILAYSTFLGGIGLDRARGIAVDSTGAAYVVGETTSATFPTLSAAQGTGGGSMDVFVTKLNPAGNALVYSTYLGGSLDDAGLSIALDAANNAYITGYTQSTNFPTQAAARGSSAGGTDGFIAKLGPNGNTLIFSTYLGGSGEDRGVSIAADSTGAYVAGNTSSADFPTVSALFPSYRGGTRDGFIVKVGTAGAIGFSSFFGGSADDSATGIAVDSSGIYVAGYTSSTDLPLQGALYGASAGGVDAFAAKINLAGNAITYSTYLGGSSDDRATSIAIDSTGAAYIAGWTYSSNFPRSSAYSSTFGGVFDGFLTKLNAAGSALVYSTFLGGNGEDLITSVAVDANN